MAVSCWPWPRRPAAEPDRLVELDFADLLQLADVRRRDLAQIDVPLAGVVLIDRDPVLLLIGPGEGPYDDDSATALSASSAASMTDLFMRSLLLPSLTLC